MSAFIVVVSFTLLFLFGYGVYDSFNNVDKNQCEMTYMYEYPQFAEINMGNETRDKFPRYRLFAYGEGRYANMLRASKYHGAPVLFIPGNGGSYKQVRSVASVALRMWTDARLQRHLNVFTVDFDEDLAAISGHLLYRQTQYVALSIAAIQALYNAQQVSVAVVAHSMGGVVARGLFREPGFDPRSVHLIYTLAAPIAEPPVYIDAAMTRYYAEVDHHWRLHGNASLSDVTLVSLSGGERDLQVRPHHTRHSTSTISATTTSVPGVWTSADHQCIVWCRQLVLVLVRSIFDLLDGSGQVTTDPKLKRSVLNHYFVQRTHGKRWRQVQHSLGSVSLETESSDWIQNNLRQWNFTADRVERHTYLMVPLTSNPLHQKLNVLSTGLNVRDWLFVCSVSTTRHDGSRVCERGDNLSVLGHVLPSISGRRRGVAVALDELHSTGGYTHVVVALRPTDKPVSVHLDVAAVSDRTVSVALPAFTSFREFFRSHLVVRKTVPAAVSYNITLQGLSETWQAVRVWLTPNNGECTDSSRALLRFHVPWAQDTTVKHVSGKSAGSIAVKLQTPVPSGSDNGNYSNPYVEVFLDPGCTYSISVQTSFWEIWGQVARFYCPLLLPVSVAVTMATLAEQLRASAAGNQLAAPSALALVSPVKLLMPSRIISTISDYGGLSAWLPVPDLQLIASAGLAFSMMPFMLYFICWAQMALLLFAASWLVALIGGIMHRLSLGVLSRSLGVPETVAEWMVAGAVRFPVFLSAALAALALSSCGEIAIGLGLMVCCVKIFQCYEDGLSGDDDGAIHRTHTLVTLTLLWTWVTVIHLPSLVVWSGTLRENRQLVGDPSLLPALMLCASGAVLWRDSTPRVNIVGYKHLSGLVNVAAVLVVLYALVLWHRLSWLLCCVVMVTALHQLLAPPTESSDQRPSDDSSSDVTADSDSCQDDVISSGESAHTSELETSNCDVTETAPDDVTDDCCGIQG